MMGGILDTYRVVSGQLRLARWLVPLFDILYWLAAMVLVFRILYWTNLGEVRLFIFLGLLAGIAIYYTLLSAYVIRYVRLLLKWITAGYRLLLNLIRIFIIKPLIFIYRVLLAILMFFGTASIFLCKFVLQLVYPLWRLVRKPLTAFVKSIRLDAAHRWIRSKISRFKRDK